MTKRPLPDPVAAAPGPEHLRVSGPARPALMHRIARVRQFLEDVLFAPAPGLRARAAGMAVLLVLFGVGVVHWIVFFNFGNLTFRSADWPKEYLYFSVLQQAVSTGTVPYHVDQALQSTQRFLALPETAKSPQILLLPFMDIGDFVVVNTLIAYAIGFWGCLLIRRRYTLSLVSFAVLFLLFHFNGYITAHLATGHSMWNGYFLMPFYCYYVLRLCETTTESAASDARVPLALALTLFVMNLQGAFHMYVWNVLFLGLLAAFNTRLARPIAVAVAYSALLSAFIILPAAITYWNFAAAEPFFTGYPSVGVLIEAFVYIRRFDIDTAPATGLVADVGWWEYDMFIGVLPFVALLYLGVWLRWSTPATLAGALRGTEYRPLDWPMAVMSVLSMSAFYAVVTFLPIPLLNSERVPSRFLITPFLFLLIVSCIRFDRVLAAWGGAWVRAPLSPVKWLIVVGLAQIGFELASHSKAWSVDKWPIEFFEGEVDFNISIVQQTDPLYELTVQGSLAVALATLAVLIYRYSRSTVVRAHPDSP